MKDDIEITTIDFPVGMGVFKVVNGFTREETCQFCGLPLYPSGIQKGSVLVSCTGDHDQGADK